MVSHNLAPARAWFARLADDNSREFWARERAAYETDVRRPFLDLLAEVAAGDDLAAWKVYRPHHDTRFSNAKGVLKSFIGALRVHADGTGAYLQLDARGVLASSGAPYFAPDQLPRWRTALLGEPGEAFERLVAEARNAGGTLKSGYPEPLKTAPRGVDPGHPRIAWLRWKGVEVYARTDTSGADVAERVRDAWRAGSPLCAWLGEHVGPSALERPRR